MLVIVGDESQCTDDDPAGADAGAGSTTARRSSRPACSSPARACSRPPRRPRCACTTASASLTDGPFAETKEQLGGFYLIECKDLDEAIDWAAKIPCAQRGSSRSARSWTTRRRRAAPRSCRSQRQADAQLAGRPAATAESHRRFRRESGRAVATLIRVLGDFDLAEDAVQEAFVIALERWPRDGVPRQPGRLDHARRRATARSTACAASGATRTSCASSSALIAAGRARGPDRTRRRARRPPAADLHLLPPGARARGARGADAAHARRADDARGRARVPDRRADDGAAPRARQAQDPRRRHPVRGAAPTTSCPTGCARCCAVLYLIFNEGYLGDERRRAGARASCATRRSGWRACCAS